MRKLLAVLVLVTCGVALAVGPSQGLAQAKGNDDLALTLSKLMLTEDLYKQMLEQMTAGMAQSMAANKANMPPDFAEKMALVVREALPYKDMLRFNAEIYGSRFSDKELQEIIVFYRTPTGAKILREMPGISREVMVKVGELIPQRLPQLMKKHGLMPKE